MSLPTIARSTIVRPAWLSPKIARTEVLAGLVVALALIPEATHGTQVTIVGLNPASAQMHDQLAGRLGVAS